MDIEKLKALYAIGWIKLPKVEKLLADGKITQEDFDYIIGGN